MDDDAGECEALRLLIEEAVEKCKDCDLLNLIYKLLIA